MNRAWNSGLNYSQAQTPPTSSSAADSKRSSGRIPKKKREYVDDYSSDSEAIPRPPVKSETATKLKVLGGRIKKKKRKLTESSSSDNVKPKREIRTRDRGDEREVRASVKAAATAASTPTPENDAFEDGIAAEMELGGDGPPAGTLPSLWYSSESMLQLFVIEKIMGWKSRPKPSLAGASFEPSLSLDVALKLHAQALTDVSQKKRMEISRIYAMNCPAILDAYGSLKGVHKKENAELLHLKQQTEQVILIKWRGRSYRHCSWERPFDLERFDPSNNTAKGKIKRYMASQELALGRDWKQVVMADLEAGNHEYFPPDCLEIERILSCDEKDMDMQVLAKQRSLNLRAAVQAEKELLKEQAKLTDSTNDAEPEATVVPKKKKKKKLASLFTDENWDPEDNVRYVVKWKGQPSSELTWEYWLDLKHDFVEAAEDFWYRQQIPSEAEIDGMPHPSIQNFVKLDVSPVFGVSTKKRPTTDLGDGIDYAEEEAAASALRLRSYQLEGVNWLVWNWWNRRSCILADEMGLGKTIQTMALLERLIHLPETSVRGPFLIVAPLSLIAQWSSECQVWAPDLNAVLYHGSADARAYMVKNEFWYSEPFVSKSTAGSLKRQGVTKFHLLITTYEVVMKDINVFTKVKWRALIVDEAHRLKNTNSRLFLELATVPREFCVLLTGTPLQNSTEELWALLNFADPVHFISKENFVTQFGQLTDAKQVSDLHSILKPYLLRRVKEDVAKSLPPKVETILEVSLTPIQKTYYKAIYEKNTNFLFKGSKPSNAPSLMNIMMELRKCCNHPFLIRGAEERILNDAAGPTDALTMRSIYAEQLVKSSGKLVLLTKLLAKLYDGGHKVLIFSQMVRVLDILADLLRIKQYKFERLDGSTSASARAAAVARFHKKNLERFVMLLSTRAGGLGLNLTAADTVIIFDSDWNPQNDLQAMARAHRIGQTRAVRVYRLLTAKTYEMHMFHSASMKLGLDRAVLAHQRQNEADNQGEGGSSKTGEKKSKSEKERQAREIDELLKKGAYDVFKEDDDKEVQKFMESDIDQLLEQSSRTVTYGDQNNTASSGLGSFSKASFVASGEGDGKDVDLDDPDFWQKAVGLEKPEKNPIGADDLMFDDKKRSRKQVQVFDPYAQFAEAEQKKKDKVAQKIQEEKNEKEKARLEKRKRKEEDKEKRQKEREVAKDAKDKIIQKKELVDGDGLSAKERKNLRDGRAKKLKRLERNRALRRAENSDPPCERIKQAWEISQREKVTSAALRFGFARFCKIRQESHLTSLPIQDVEVFLRSYLLQLGLQSYVCLLPQKDKNSSNIVTEYSDDLFAHVEKVFSSLSSIMNPAEAKWIGHSILISLKAFSDILNSKRILRMPLALNDEAYVSELRNGAALLALRRFGFLSRLNGVIENALDKMLLDLGPEELGKRGCCTKNLQELDLDLKAKLVSTEEFSHALDFFLDFENYCEQVWSSHGIPQWWDLSCDVGLVVGTFVHGLGNYESMRQDTQLPFGWKLSIYSTIDPYLRDGMDRFESAVKAAKTAYEDARERAKVKSQEQTHAAVAAAVAASKLAEERELQEIGSKSDEKSHTTQVVKTEDSDKINVTISTPGDQDAKDKCLQPTNSSNSTKDNSDTITLTCLSNALVRGLRSVSSHTQKSMQISSQTSAKNGGKKDHSESSQRKQVSSFNQLPMPDSRILDQRLSLIIDLMEAKVRGNTLTPPSSDKITSILGPRLTGFCGNKCGSTFKNTLDDGSNYVDGVASADLASLCTGPDSLKYKRGDNVPMTLTRICISALIYADDSVMNLLCGEKHESKPVDGGECLTGSNPLVNLSDIIVESPTTFQAMKEKHTLTDQSKLSFHEIFESSSKNRNYACRSVIITGYFPLSDERHKRVDEKLLEVFIDAVGASYQNGDFICTYLTAEKFVMDAGLLFDNMTPDALNNYIKNMLLPHCLRVCLHSADLRSNTSLYNDDQCHCTLPDPCRTLEAHTEDAIMASLKILRRVQLARCIRFIAGGGISADKIIKFLKGPVMRKNFDGLPTWWCPWIHDLALLIQAAMNGVLSVLKDRNKNNTEERVPIAIHLALGKDAVREHVQTTFFEQSRGSIASLPSSFLVNAPQADIDACVETLASQFPSANVIEKRLVMICSELTTTCKDGSIVFDNIPLFDHDGSLVSSQIVAHGQNGLETFHSNLLGTMENSFESNY